MQIQSALAPENQPDYTQLKNETYLMQSFEKLVGDLEAPFGVRPLDLLSCCSHLWPFELHILRLMQLARNSCGLLHSEKSCRASNC